MADRTPEQEQDVINAEMRLSQTALRLQKTLETLERADDRIRDTRHREVSQWEDRPLERAAQPAALPASPRPLGDELCVPASVRVVRSPKSSCPDARELATIG
jgi:hypothetical protein